MPTKRNSRWGSGSRRRGRPRLLLVLFVLLAGCGSAHAPAALKLPQGHPVLVSFLDTQARPSADGDPSRSQLVFLKSMDTQSHRSGLRTIVVDAAHTLGITPPSRADLVNLRYDWSLPPRIRLVGDPSGALARRYRVTKVPTTLLLDAHGRVVDRWAGFAPAATLDFAVRKITGRHRFGS